MIVHCKKASYDMYIGRPSPWGNPFVTGKDGDRDTVIQKFSDWLDTGENFGNKDATLAARKWILDHVHELKGKILACWCSPRRCHGDILARLAL